RRRGGCTTRLASYGFLTATRGNYATLRLGEQKHAQATRFIDCDDFSCFLLRVPNRNPPPRPSLGAAARLHPAPAGGRRPRRRPSRWSPPRTAPFAARRQPPNLFAARQPRSGVARLRKLAAAKPAFPLQPDMHPAR